MIVRTARPFVLLYCLLHRLCMMISTIASDHLIYGVRIDILYWMAIHHHRIVHESR